jgi:hypothetical protein
LALEFEWDPQKAVTNLAKRGVSLEEAATVFGDPLGLIVADPCCWDSRKIGGCLQSCEEPAEFRKTACLRARLILPALKQELILSRDREGAVRLADSAEYWS